MLLISALSHITYFHQPQLAGITWTQRDTSNAPIPAGSLVKVFISFSNVIDWPLQPILQLLPPSHNNAQRGRRSAEDIPHHPNLSLIACSTDWTLGFSTLDLTYGLLIKSSHHILPMVRTLFKHRKS